MGTALRDSAHYADAVEPLQKARALGADGGTVVVLCHVLTQLERFDEAERAGRDAVRLAPRNAEAHYRLGYVLGDTKAVGGGGRLLPPIDRGPTGAGRVLQPGGALQALGRHDQAEQALRAALRMEPDYALAHYALGKLRLHQRGDAAGAVASLCESIRLRPDDPKAHHALGNALAKLRNLGGAVAAYREAIRLRPDYPDAHYNLGNARRQLSDLRGAEAAYREAIRLRPDYPEAHCNLGHCLRDDGRYAEALGFLRQGHELGRRTSGWKYPSSDWVKECEPLAALEQRLPEILAGTVAPKDENDAQELVDVCVAKRLYAGAVCVYREAFRFNPKWETAHVDAWRFEAALLAARAGCGEGVDTPRPSDADRVALRRQALTWLRQEFGYYFRNPARTGVREQLPAILGKWTTCPGAEGSPGEGGPGPSAGRRAARVGGIMGGRRGAAGAGRELNCAGPRTSPAAAPGAPLKIFCVLLKRAVTPGTR